MGSGNSGVTVMGKFGVIVALGAMVGLAGCAETITTSVQFDPAEVSYINQSGPGRIEGQAFLRQRGGGVVTCAGTEVKLIPAGDYARDRLSQIYGSQEGGRIPVLGSVSQENVPQEYLTMIRTATCDADGNFAFSGLAIGEYYVLASVTWTVGGSYVPEGGAIMRLVNVGSTPVRVILS